MSVLDDLRSVAAALEGGAPEARFVANELRLVETGFARAAAANEASDYLAAVMWKRLALESTLRISWIVGDAFEADDEGELITDPNEVRSRCQRLRARDALNLLAAYKAITEAGGRSVDADLMRGMTRLVSSRAAVAAPRSLSDMAIDVAQKALYAQYRLCSAVVHPGELAGSETARRKASLLVEEVAVMAVSFSRSVLRALVP